VIGIGSPFGDDRAGWAVIEQLEQWTLPADVSLLKLDRPGPALLDWLNRDTNTVLIDAVQTSNHPCGHWMELSLEQLDHSNDLSSHGFGLAQTLALARALGQLPQQYRLIGFCIPPGASPPAQSDLSVAAAAGITQLTAWLAEQLEATSAQSQTATGSGGVGSIGSSSRSDRSRR